MELIKKYFPNLSEEQINSFSAMEDLYSKANQKVNVISRKDIENLYLKHVLHSLAIAKILEFTPNTKILDVGTGGGFPGIPLAILFPECKFTLIDSIGKKVKVVEEIAAILKLQNVKAQQVRAENINEKFDFVVSRAVTQLPRFYVWVKSIFIKENQNSLPNGILYLKGGDLNQEISSINNQIKQFEITDFFNEEFFLEKKVLYLRRFK